MTKKTGMTEEELKALVDQEVWSAHGYVGKLSEQRRRALEYYEAKPTGDLAPAEVEGRSSVVSPDVADAIDGCMPQFMRIFASGDEVVRFDPKKPEDEEAAQLATDYVNWLFWSQNDGFKIAYTWIKDALLSKNGVVKVYCDRSKEITEEPYEGLTEAQMASVVEPDEVEVLSHEETPDQQDIEHRKEAEKQAAQMEASGDPNAMQQAMQIRQSLAQPPKVLHSIKVKRTTTKRKIVVENIPPEEFLISRKAKSLDEPNGIIGHRVQRTLSQLLAAGYDKDQVMRLNDDNNWSQYNAEAVERKINDDEWTPNSALQDGVDPMSRKVWLVEGYIQVDYDGDDYAEWRKIVKAGFEILENEMCDGNPFADMTPTIMPHRFFGKSMADQAADWQRVKTALLRQLLDALYLGNNPRHEAVEGQVNFDDLLTSRPGGVVRVKAIGMVQQLTTQDVSAQAITGLQFISGIVNDRTGVKPMNGSLDPNAINKTATGEHMLQDAAMQKIELIARVFAECGFKRLFKLLLKESIRYQDKPAMVKLSGKWVEIDPQEWKRGFDLSISVGLGTGDRAKQAMNLQQMISAQMQALQIGAATPKNVYTALKKLPGILGYKEELFTDPGDQPHQQPGPLQIEQAKGQVTMQVEQMKAQAQAQTEHARMQMEHQLEQARMQMQAQVDTHRQQVEAQQQMARMQAERELEQFKAQLQDQQHQRDAEYAMRTAIAVAQINAQAKVEAAELQASKTPSTLTPEQQGAAG